MEEAPVGAVMGEQEDKTQETRREMMMMGIKWLKKERKTHEQVKKGNLS